MPYRDPEKRRQAARESQRRRRAAGVASTPSTRVEPMTPEELRKVEGVLEALAREVAAIQSDAGLKSTERGRCVAYIAAVLLRAIEVGDLEGRLAALESRLGQSGMPLSVQ